MTVHFLGERPEGDLEALRAVIAGAPATAIPLAAAGALWLAPRRPHVLTLALEDTTGALRRLHRAPGARAGGRDAGLEPRDAPAAPACHRGPRAAGRASPPAGASGAACAVVRGDRGGAPAVPPEPRRRRLRAARAALAAQGRLTACAASPRSGAGAVTPAFLGSRFRPIQAGTCCVQHDERGRRNAR